MLVSAHSLIRCDLLSLNPILFICNFLVLFFHTTTTKSSISKPIFWCTTLITLYIQIHAKGLLNKPLPLLLIFWVAFALYMPLHDFPFKWELEESTDFLKHGNSKIVQFSLLSLIHISEPTRRTPISYAVFCLKKKVQENCKWKEWGLVIKGHIESRNELKLT